MNVNITFRHLESTEALKNHVQERAEHIQKYFKRPCEAHVVLHVEKQEHCVEVTLQAGPFALQSHARSSDMYASIDAAIEKLERQLKKHKERLASHKQTMIPHGWVPMDVRHGVLDGVAVDPIPPSRKVVANTSSHAKPMTLDEAVLQMDLLDDPQPLIFQDPGARTLNVLYRRQDGKYGLIEAMV